MSGWVLPCASNELAKEEPYGDAVYGTPSKSINQPRLEIARSPYLRVIVFSIGNSRDDVPIQTL
jgi:hypothetical protein